MIVSQLELPYYAVIFTTIMEGIIEGYPYTTERMEILVKIQKGYLGIKSARSDIGITFSYWQTLADSTHWKNNI